MIFERWLKPFPPPPPPPPPEPVPGAMLGVKVWGDLMLPRHDHYSVIPLEKFVRHILVLGASGSGKTETLLRLAYSVAKESDWRIFYVDGKGSQNTLASGRETTRAGPSTNTQAPKKPSFSTQTEA